ncbi:hypothetical protein [Amycolatopsis keratiniphila]|uniref:HxlR family transcriptional regulator n=1 Tax=Amycolatopsis keratiniphila TaxID=129921 RepID=R4SN10_9PSEU|nr:hypothetical protein [Amycolatopsis keratiniphila]AGM04095.1 HxlR family transcriptional regulator [Amycolatopsis keratiniphila]
MPENEETHLDRTAAKLVVAVELAEAVTEPPWTDGVSRPVVEGVRVWGEAHLERTLGDTAPNAAMGCADVIG